MNKMDLFCLNELDLKLNKIDKFILSLENLSILSWKTILGHTVNTIKN